MNQAAKGGSRDFLPLMEGQKCPIGTRCAVRFGFGLKGAAAERQLCITRSACRWRGGQLGGT